MRISKPSLKYRYHYLQLSGQANLNFDYCKIVSVQLDFIRIPLVSQLCAGARGTRPLPLITNQYVPPIVSFSLRSTCCLKLTLKVTICLAVKRFQLFLGGDPRISVRVVIGYGMLGH